MFFFLPLIFFLPSFISIFLTLFLSSSVHILFSSPPAVPFLVLSLSAQAFLTLAFSVSLVYLQSPSLECWQKHFFL